MPKKVSTTALIAYQDLEKALRAEGLWEAVEGLVQEVRDTSYEWGVREGWDDAQHRLAQEPTERTP